MYPIIVFIHAFSALVSICPYVILFPMLRKLQLAQGELFLMYLSVFKTVVRISKHAGHVLVISGLTLLWLGNWTWTPPWIAATMAILFSLLFFLARAFTPTIRKLEQTEQELSSAQTKSLESDRLFEHDQAHERTQQLEYEQHRTKLLRKLGRALYMYVFVLLLLLWLMMMKPMLW